MGRDWHEWHRAYEDPDSSLSKRLQVVSGMIRRHIDRAAAGPIRVLSLCAGDARDLTQATDGHVRVTDIVGAVVEFDQTLADRAEANLQRVGVGVGLDVRCADAGITATFSDVLPVDLLLLVGIFGNISNDDVRATISTVPHLCRAGATIVWTRHRREPDLTPQIREWFDAAGCRSAEFATEGVGRFAVGAETLTARSNESALPNTLFTFQDDLW